MVHELARQLIALETPHASAKGSGVARVLGKLRVILEKLAGKAGYQALISRAVALAKVDAPALEPMRVAADGGFEGFDAIVEDHPDAGVAVLAQLLDLLIVFVGLPLTLSLVRDTWPDALGVADLGAEEKP